MPSPEYRPRWTGEVSTLTINALVSGLTASIPRVYREPSLKTFFDSFGRGALGGGVEYVGKRIAVERWAGAGLLGRQTNAIGVSMVANASAGRPLLSQVVLPFGPVRVYAQPSRGWKVHGKVDLATTAAIVYTASQPETRLDVQKSLSAGAPVFFTENARPFFAPEGRHAAGVVSVEATRSDWGQQAELSATIFAHERVHVLQHDFALLALGAPAQRQLLAWVPGGGLLDRYVDLGLHSIVWAGLNEAVPYDSRPWEREAHFLSNRPRDQRVRAGTADRRSSTTGTAERP